jgi:hypothetical protein
MGIRKWKTTHQPRAEIDFSRFGTALTDLGQHAKKRENLLHDIVILWPLPKTHRAIMSLPDTITIL